ncbi:MAG: TetR/AcrR family transcriptional regulator [Pseudodonghicola sp.]
MPAQEKDSPNRQDQRSEATRKRICKATIACLDRHGYAETSFARVQEQAGLSRGAITHHFPSKESLVAATAMELLANALEPVEQRRTQAAPTPVRDLILQAWDRVVNSSGGRAMVEILVACRSDRALHALLEDQLHDWDRQSRASITRNYIGEDAEDAELLWSITRNFLRGLILHEQFTGDPAYLARMVDRFARMMEAELHPLPPDK